MIDEPACEICADEIHDRLSVIESLADHNLILCEDCQEADEYMSTCDDCGAGDAEKLTGPSAIPTMGSAVTVYACRACPAEWV